ncbi:MAG: HAD-IIB family hydrolase [Deltaproteobacteria bacterium]|nr:HAD-IIB family hydrolase [Deltaproteobacteria bacterium]
MLPLEALPAGEARALEAVLFDLDDTVLDAGRLGLAAYGALYALADAGLLLVAVTGRPLGWAEVLARQWPIEGVVAENGAVSVARTTGGVAVVDAAGADRARRTEWLDALVATLRREFPDLVPADDVGARRADRTFDVGEHQTVAPARVEAVARRARELGARTVRSSIHLHVTLDGADKASGALAFLAPRLGGDRTRIRRLAAFVGDSENDAPCFAAFSTTIGVANLRGRPTVPPRYVTRSPAGAGFAEAAALLLARRRAPPETDPAGRW